MRRALAILLMTGTAWAGDCTNCTVIPYSSPAPITQCLMAYKRVRVAVDECDAALAAKDDQIEQLQSLLSETAKLAPVASVETVVHVEPKKRKARLPCKKGRTRNSRGICGRW